MNTTIKLGVASALAFGAVAAHASIAQPASGASDAILFAQVLNSAGSSVASYAGDTGVSISTLTAGLTGSTVVLGSDANLTKLFAADASGDTIQWAVEGGQYLGAQSSANFKTPGAAKFITTATLDATANLSHETVNNLTHWGNIDQTISQINTNSGGAKSIESASVANGGVWDQTDPSGISGWFSNGPVTGNLLGGTQSLFYVTGAGSLLADNTIKTIGTATLSASGLTLAAVGGGTTPPVPLPAAVWLLGSGLLGLTGVARRKLKA